jgi:GNAT superfamily N-acetyltransferase
LPLVPVTVRPVEGGRDLKRFIELPYRLRREDPQWVPPLRFERRQFLDRRKNPYFEHAEAEYLVCERDGEVVGRITAQVDQRWDEFQGGNDGMFGFLELENDPEVARALVGAASAWVRERGRDRILGPMDFTTNNECGLLVDGYEAQPIILQPWNPPYYKELLEGLGMTKAMDMRMWDLWLGKLKEGNEFDPMIKAAAKVADDKGVIVRKMRKHDLEAEIGRFMEVYNEAWSRNWGFVPITEAEVKYQAKNLRPVLVEDWAMIAEQNGVVVGAALTLPDINQVLKKMNGRLFPFGWWHFLTGRRKIDRVRVFALGVKREYQHLGVAAALYERHRETANRMPQKGGQTGWILETNKSMNRAMEGMGGTVAATYRLYEQAL